MNLPAALDFARARRQGVLITIGRDGRPQASNILYHLDGEGVARISVTESRRKTKNLRGDPRCSLYVVGDNFWVYAVLEGTAELAPVARDPNDATVDELIELYRGASGSEHPDWDDYRRSMVAEGRLVIRLRPERAYGQIPG